MLAETSTDLICVLEPTGARALRVARLPRAARARARGAARPPVHRPRPRRRRRRRRRGARRRGDGEERRCRSPTACAAPAGTVWVETRLRVVRDPATRAVVESHATVRDVAERMQSQAALAEAEERFRSAFEEAPIGMALTSPDFRFLRVNRALCQITGYTPRAARGAAGRLDHPPRRPQGRLGGARRDARGRAVEPPRRAALPARRRAARCGWRSTRRSCATPTASRCTSSPRCRTSPSAAATRPSCATWPTTTR